MFIFLPIKKVYVPIDRVGFLSSWGFPGASDSKESACNAGDMGSIPGSGRSSGEGKWQPTPIFSPDPLQYSRLENSMDRGAWQSTVHGVAKIQTQLSS